MEQDLNIPIYRAKKIDSGEYIVGYYRHEKRWWYMQLTEANIISNCKYIGGEEDEVAEIDISTLSIHFPDMLDSQGNKIFASLSEDGKGGDICIHLQSLGGIIQPFGPEKCIIKYSSRDHLIAAYFIQAKYKGQKTYMTKEHLTVIGIQE